MDGQWSLLHFLQSQIDEKANETVQQCPSEDSAAFAGHFDVPGRCGDWQQEEFVAPFGSVSDTPKQTRVALLSHEMQPEEPPTTSSPIGLAFNRTTKANSKHQQQQDQMATLKTALLVHCESFGDSMGLSPVQLASQIVQNAQQSSEEQLQSELFGLVGVEGMDLIAFVVQNRTELAKIQVKSLQEPAAASASAAAAAQERVPIYGSAFSIQTQSELQSQKQQKRLSRRAKNKGSTNSSSPTTNWLEASGYDPEVLRLQREFAEEEARQTPTSLLQEQFGILEGGYDTSNAAGLLNTAGRFTLPDRAKRTQHSFYEKVYIPASTAPKFHNKNQRLVPIEELEVFARSAFKGITHLNRLQSELFRAAYHSNQNLLVCAPTGAGKTNVAMLTVVQEIKSQLVRKAPQLLHSPPIPSDVHGKETPNSIGDKLRDVKIIYVAPMKALAQEVVTRFSKRLRDLGLQVAECTGDMHLTRKEIEATHVIVTTPEKWDVITRKSGTQQSLINQVRLLILDEVHLLADERGPVIETIVARTLRRVESSQSMIRIVGLSATLPNYQDVAKFLRVGNSPATGLFHFDTSYRPVPLDQTFIGVSTQKAKEDPEQSQEPEQSDQQTLKDGEGDNRRRVHVKRTLSGRQLVQYRMNKLTYEHCVKQLRQAQQVMVFVHSRKETAATIRAIVELSREAQGKTDSGAGAGTDGPLADGGSPVKPHARFNGKDKRNKAIKKPKDSSEDDNDADANVFREFDFAQTLPIELSQKVAKSRNRELKEFLAYGMGIHHAGMLRYDRNLTEELFEKGYVRVLCCTATLAWGVNLPAHSVLIKGTEVYNADKGGISQLSMLDVMQIFGRAGRPQYDTFGEATLLTTQDQLSHFLRLLCNGIPIESSLIKFLPDHLNAEIVSGSVCNMQEALEWLSYTYLFVRMQRNPLAYGVGLDEKQSDPQLVQRRQQLITQAVDKLVSCRMIKCFQQGLDAKNGLFAVTSLGRVASHFYICHQSVETFNELLVPHVRSVVENPGGQQEEEPEESFSMERVLLVICSSTEFEQLKSREEEMNELDKLRKNFCRFDVLGGGVESYAGKTNVLLQSFISKARVSSFTLISDTNYVAQNASRVCRALFEICLKKNNSDQAEKFLWVAKSIDQRLWWDQSPLFQVPLCSMDTIAALESRRLDPYELLADDLFVNGLKDRKKKQRDGPQEMENALLPSKFKRFVAQLPFLDLLRAKMQPIGTGNVLKVGLELVPLFDWSERMHGGAESWWIWMEDAISGHIYHSEHFFLHAGRFYQWKDHVRKLQAQASMDANEDASTTVASESLKGMEMEFYVPIFLNDQQDEASYTLRILSDKWVGIENFYELTYRPATIKNSETKAGVVLYTKQLNLHPVPLQVIASAVEDRALFDLFASKCDVQLLNPLQSQVVHEIVHKRNHLLLAMPSASGKTLLAESAMLSLWGRRPSSSSDPGLVLYVTPFQELARQMAREWRWKFSAGNIANKKIKCELPLVELLDDGVTEDLSKVKALLDRFGQPRCHRGLLVATAAQWEVVTRQMSERFVKKIGLVLVDELQFLGNNVASACHDSSVDGPVGLLMETVVTRLRRVSCKATNDSIRFVGLSSTLANAKSVGNWLGCCANNEIHNFHASNRPSPLQIHIQGFPEPHYVSRMTAMNKPTFAAIEEYSGGRSSLVFVSSRAQTRLTAIDLISSCASSSSSQDSTMLAGGKRFLKMDEESLEFLCAQRVQDDTLKHTLSFGIALYHEHLNRKEKDFVVELYQNQQVQVLIATYTSLWELKARLLHPSVVNDQDEPQRLTEIGLVVVKGTKYYGADVEKDNATTASTSGYRDYELAEIWEMIGFAWAEPATACVLVDERKTNFIKRFLNEPLAIESSLGDHLAAFLHAEIASASSNRLHTVKDLLDLLSYSLFFQRIVENPAFYRSIVFDQLEALAAQAEKKTSAGPVGKNPVSHAMNNKLKKPEQHQFAEEGEYLKTRILDALRQLENLRCLQVDWPKKSFSLSFAGSLAAQHQVSFASMGRLEARINGSSASFENKQNKPPAERPDFLEILKLLSDSCVELESFSLRANEITNKRFWRCCESVRLHPFEYVADGKLKTLFNASGQQKQNQNNLWRKLEKHGKDVKLLTLLQLHLLRVRAASKAMGQELRELVRVLPRLLKSLIELAGHHEQSDLVMKAIGLYQAVARGSWPGEATMYRLPHWSQECMQLLNTEMAIATIEDFQDATKDDSNWGKIQQLLRDKCNLSSNQLEQVKQEVTAFPRCRVHATRHASTVKVEVHRSQPSRSESVVRQLSGVFVLVTVAKTGAVLAASHVEIEQGTNSICLEILNPSAQAVEGINVTVWADDSAEVLQRVLIDN